MPRAPRVDLIQEAVLDEPAAPAAPRSRRLRRLLLLLAPFVALLMFSIVTAMQATSPRQEVVDAATRWAEHGPASYELAYVIEADGDVVGAASVVVTDGVLASYETASPELEDRIVYTVEATFFRIEDVARDDADAVLAVDYDPDLGYARSVTLDLKPGQQGGEWTMTVADFAAR